MADPISVQDLDQFLKSPSPSKAKMDTPPPAPVSMGPGKPIPQIKNAADLDNFLKQPVQGFESYRKERLTGKRPASTEPSTLEKFGEAIPEWSVPALRGANYVAQLPVRAGEAGAKAVGEFAGNAVTSLASAFDLVGHPGRWGAYFPHQGPTAPVESPEATVEREYPNALPIVRGAAKAVGEVAGGTVADPRNWPFFFSSSARPILQRIISGGFGLQMATGTIQAAQNLLHNWSKMTPEQRTEAAVQGGLTAAMTYGALSHALSAHLAEEFLQKNPDATTDEVRTQTASRLEEIKNKLAGMPAAQRATELQAMGLPADLTIDHVQTALDHINSLRAERPAIEPPPPPPEKTHREGPDYYAINVRPMSPVERDARRYSLDEARKQLDAERNVAAQEQTARDAAEQERQRVARERQANVEGEAAYREARAGRTLVVQERRPLEFNNESAKANYEESQRLGEVLDNIAVEHMYENTEDMIRSLRMERYRGVDLKSKYGDWADNALKTEARQKEYLKLSDPRALEPKKTDVLRDTAQDMRLAEREMNMRDAANKIDREAQKNVTDPEVFEKAKAEADEARKLAEDLRTQRDEAAARRASQIADRQIYPVGAPIDLQVGSATEVLLPSGRRLPAHYAIALGDQIITSHNPLTFEWNDDYGPRQAQPRDYSTNQEAQAGVITGGNAPEPDRIHTDDPTAHNGPPVIRRDGLVLGGNGRTMRLQRAYRLGNGDVVFRHLRSKLGQFGLDSMPDLEKKPTLVRVLDDDVETAEDLFVLGRDLNRTETMGFDPAEQAVVAGRAISDQMLEWGTAQMDMLGEDASVRDFMRARGAEIVQRMIDSGMIEPTKRAAYVAKNGEMTEAAKDLFEAAWLGKIVDDADLLKTTPKEILRKLSRAVPGLMKAKAAGAMWDISPEVKQALDLWKRINSIRDSLNEIGTKADSLVDKYLHPEDFENGTQLMDYGAGTARETPHPTVEAIAKLLEKPQVEVRNGFADYGNEAEGKQQTLGPPPEPVESFNRFIGSKVGIEINPDQWAVPMAEAPKAAVLAPEKALEPLSAAAATETTPAVPPPLETTPKPTGDVVEKLRAVLNQHPGFQGEADDVLQVADILSRNGMGKPLNEALPEVLADVRTEGKPGAGAMGQSITDIGNWARRAGKKLMITPYGEQLGLFGGAEPQFILRNRVGDERLVLKSELMKLRDAVPRVAEMVDADGNVKQPELFGAEEENLFGPGPDEEEPPQGTLFQEPAVSIKDVANPERDTRILNEVRSEHPDWSLSEQLQEAAKRARGVLEQAKKGATEFLDDGKAILYLYKTADASTFMHEFFHIMRRHISPEDGKVLEDWLKIKEHKWSRKDEETAARAFEYYHRQREVKTLPENVRAVFQKIQNVMRQIYAAIKGSPLVKPSKEVSALFDRWYGMEAPPEAPGEARTDVEPTPPEPRGVEAVSQPAVQTATEAIPEELGPKKETIPAASEMEQPPLSTAEREGAELVAEGGRRLLDTGKVKAKVFPAFDEAQRWATTNAKKIRSLQMYRLRDGRYVADFVPQNEKVLFQRDETGDINREISGLQKRLMSIMPEEQRSRIAQRLFDLEERRRTVAAPATSLEPLPGKVVRLWTPEGEEAVVPPPLEVKRAETQPVRTAANEPARLPEPPRFGGVPERPEPSRIPRPEPAPGRPVRAGRGTEEPRVVGGQPTGTLRDVTPIRIDAPDRPSKPPVYSDKDWTDKVKLYELPENAPTPTVGISNNLARMLMGGQRYVVESALSGLDRYNSYVLAMPTGSGKTFQSAAILHHILGEKPDAQVLILTTSRGLIDSKGGFKDVMGDFGIEVQDLDKNGPTGAPGVYAETWAGSGNRPGIETHPWDLVIADEVQEARKWWSSQRGQRMKAMGGNAKKVLYMSATPFHTALEIGHMDKLGLWDKEGYEAWAKQFGVHRDAEGNLAGGNAPLKLTKLRNQLIERGQFMSINKDMNGYSAHFGVVPMDGTTKQGLANIKEAMQLAENYFYAANKRGKVQPTRAQAVTLAKRWLEYSRLPQAIDLGKKLEAQGWKVIFFSENKKEFEDVFEFLQEADEGTGGRISQLLPRFPSVTDVLKQHFGDDIGIFAGKHSAARQEELTGFNEGDKKHIYATYGAGGVGVSLHDTVGNAPRAVIYLGPPWSGISFDQALGRPWRYGTRSNVRAYFLFSNAQAEMDVVTNKVAPRMESLRALVSGVHLTDPLVKALRDVPENREATLDYELGNEHRSDIDQFTKTGDVRTVTSYSELPVVSADEAKNKGMKLPGGDGATPPNVIRLFQDSADEDLIPSDMEPEALQTARGINVDIAEAFIASGAAPGNTGTRVLTPIERRAVADAVMAQAEGAARSNPGAPAQEVYTAWQNAMTQLDAILSATRGGGEGLEPPPGGMEPPPKPEPEEVGNARALGWYMFTNGRDVIRNATKAAGVPEIGQKLARDIASYHVYSGNTSGPWVDEYWRILRDNKISKDEHKVLALTLANREEHRPWIDRELMRLRSETPMNERMRAPSIRPKLCGRKSSRNSKTPMST